MNIKTQRPLNLENLQLGKQTQRVRRKTGAYVRSMRSLRQEQNTAPFSWKPGWEVAATTASTRPR